MKNSLEKKKLFALINTSILHVQANTFLRNLDFLYPAQGMVRFAQEYNEAEIPVFWKQQPHLVLACAADLIVLDLKNLSAL